jgi:hypothetical protein
MKKSADWTPLVDLALESVDGYSEPEAERVLGISDSTIRRWRQLRADGAKIPEPRGAVRDALLKIGDAQVRRGSEEGSEPELPKVGYLKPLARAEFDRLVGSYLSRGWRLRTIERAANDLVGVISGANAMRVGGAAVREFTEDEQLKVIRSNAKWVERAYAESERTLS